MYSAHHIPVACYLCLGTVCRLCLLFNKILDALDISGDAFKPVRGLSALDDRYMPKVFKHLRGLLFIKFLFALVLADLADDGDKMMGYSQCCEILFIKRFHVIFSPSM